MVSPHIKVGIKMKNYLKKIIKRDFGDVSLTLGLYHILRCYNRYTPKPERIMTKIKLRNKKRLSKTRWK